MAAMCQRALLVSTGPQTDYLFPKPLHERQPTLHILTISLLNFTASRALLGEHFEGQHARAPTRCRGV